MVADLENAGAVQRVVGHLSQEEQKMVATLEQNCAQKHEGQSRVWTGEKKIFRSKYDTHKIKWTNRVKGKTWYQICGLSPGSRIVQENWQYGKVRTIKQMCSKLSAVVALANFQQKEWNKKFVDF
jgi:hypothetical protein